MHRLLVQEPAGTGARIPGYQFISDLIYKIHLFNTLFLLLHFYSGNNTTEIETIYK